MKKIFPTNDPTKFAIVDDDVFETIQEMGLKFSIQPNRYFRSTTKIKLPGMAEKKKLQLHRFVWILKNGEEPALEVDHQDRNKSNNQYYNLRLATRKEQSQHRGKLKSNKSGYIGVSHYHKVDKRRNKNNVYDYWLMSIRKPDGKNEAKSFSYTDEGKIAAARYYDAQAKEYFGEFAGQLNFPIQTINK